MLNTGSLEFTIIQLKEGIQKGDKGILFQIILTPQSLSLTLENLIKKVWVDPRPLVRSNIQMTNWLEQQREKGESPYDACKVGKDSDSKPSAIDRIAFIHRLRCSAYLNSYL
jgi:hypothetical protein